MASNYFAEGLLRGGEMGLQLALAAKQKKFEKDMLRQRAADDLDRQARQFAAQKELQLAAQQFQGAEADKGRAFTGAENQRGRDFSAGEAEKGRTFTAGEGEKGRAFTSAQSELERAARAMALEKELAARATLAGAENAFREKQLGWAMNPQNPGNKSQEAYAKYTLAQLRDSLPGMGGGAMNEIDQEALNWARANPDDPRAAAILQKLGAGK